MSIIHIVLTSIYLAAAIGAAVITYTCYTHVKDMSVAISTTVNSGFNKVSDGAKYVGDQTNFIVNLALPVAWSSDNASVALRKDKKFVPHQGRWIGDTSNFSCNPIDPAFFFSLQNVNTSGLYNLSSLNFNSTLPLCYEFHSGGHTEADKIGYIRPDTSTPCYKFVSDNFGWYHFQFWYFNYKCLEYSYLTPPAQWYWSWFSCILFYAALAWLWGGGIILYATLIKFNIVENTLDRTNPRVLYDRIPLIYVIFRGILAPFFGAIWTIVTTVHACSITVCDRLSNDADENLFLRGIRTFFKGCLDAVVAVMSFLWNRLLRVLINVFICDATAVNWIINKNAVDFANSITNELAREMAPARRSARMTRGADALASIIADVDSRKTSAYGRSGYLGLKLMMHFNDQLRSAVDDPRCALKFDAGQWKQVARTIATRNASGPHRSPLTAAETKLRVAFEDGNWAASEPFYIPLEALSLFEIGHSDPKGLIQAHHKWSTNADKKTHYSYRDVANSPISKMIQPTEEIPQFSLENGVADPVAPKKIPSPPAKSTAPPAPPAQKTPAKGTKQKRGLNELSDDSDNESPLHGSEATTAPSPANGCSFIALAYIIPSIAQKVIVHAAAHNVGVSEIVTWLAAGTTKARDIITWLKDLPCVAAANTDDGVDARRLLSRVLQQTDGPESSDPARQGKYDSMHTVVKVTTWFHPDEGIMSPQEVAAHRDVLAVLKHIPKTANRAPHVVLCKPLDAAASKWREFDGATQRDFDVAELNDSCNSFICVKSPAAVSKLIWPSSMSKLTCVHFEMAAKMLISAARVTYEHIACPSLELQYIAGPEMNPIVIINTLSLKYSEFLTDKEPTPQWIFKMMIFDIPLNADDDVTKLDSVIRLGTSTPTIQDSIRSFVEPPPHKAAIGTFYKIRSAYNYTVFSRDRAIHRTADGSPAPDFQPAPIAPEPEVSRAAHVWVDGLQLLSKASDDQACAGCDTNFIDHEHSDFARNCSCCHKLFFGECTGILHSKQRGRDAKNITPDSPFVVLYRCPACNNRFGDDSQTVEDRENGLQRPVFKSAPQGQQGAPANDVATAPAASQQQTKTAPPPPPPEKTAPPPPPPAKTAPPPATNPPPQPPQSTPPVQPQTIPQPNAPQQPQTADPICACCKKPRSKHSYRNSRRKCQQCGCVVLGKCHGESFHKEAQGLNDRAGFFCSTCAPQQPATQQPATQQPATQQQPAATPQTKKDKKEKKAKNATAQAGQLTVVGPQQGKQYTQKTRECPSDSCGLCNVVSTEHAFNASYRKCATCTKVFYGKCHGANHCAAGAEQNHNPNYVCSACTTAAHATPEAIQQRKQAAQQLDFRDQRCVNCDNLSDAHEAGADSYRRCNTCNCFTFGACHGGPFDPTKNRDEFSCCKCRSVMTEADKVKNELAATRNIHDDIKLPPGYHWKNPDRGLGELFEDDIAARISENATSPGLGGQGFQGRLDISPTGAVTPGEVLSNIKFRSTTAIEINATQSKGTTQMHINLLKDLKLHIDNSPDWKRVPISRIVVRFLIFQFRSRTWQPQTLHRNACAITGALSSLPLYSDTQLGILLGLDPYWKRMIKYWGMISNQNQPHNQPAATAAQIHEALSHVPHNELETRLALILQWTTCARVGDILPLRKKNVVWEPATGKLSVTITEGKVMGKTQPYTVHTLVSDKILADTLTHHLHQCKDRLFPYETMQRSKRIASVNAALKKCSATLSTRSIRRGALQTMAAGGTSLETLMLFSGHKSQDTCKRYLDWGRMNGHASLEGTKAAKHLKLVPATTKNSSH